VLNLSSRRFSDGLLAWYERVHRALPWRPERGGRAVEPYEVLVSEFMLQQTRVATVVPYFQRFIARFPSVQALAKADEQTVLRQWQGLGYYSRARNLHAAAKRVMAEFSGEIPCEADDLRTLPGVGRYTAGAVGSIAFGRRVPILDGNVARVLCRLDKIGEDPRSPAVVKRLWNRAMEILPGKKVGEFNSALMELGATVCTPRSPSCPVCPVRDFCEAQAAGLQEAIPLRRKVKETPVHHRWTFCIRREKRGGEEWWIEQRPVKGRWAGMWQFITVPAGEGEPTARTVSKSLGISVSRLSPFMQVKHALTHRRYVFDVFMAEAKEKIEARAECARIWETIAGLSEYPLSRPQVKIGERLKLVTRNETGK
jgi:A/G-specific adenine glycosylase